MRSITYLISITLFLFAVISEAAPRRRVVDRNRSNIENDRGSPRGRRGPRRIRRRPVDVTPVSQRSPQRRRVADQSSHTQRSASRRAARSHREARRAERQARRSERRSARRIERRRAKRLERREQRRSRRAERRRDRGLRRHRSRPNRGVRRRYIPAYVSAPTRVVVSYADRPHHNDDVFFDNIYHDGARYGVNGDFRDESRKIERGVRKGLITPREANRLYDLLFDAYDLETECIEDGFLSAQEEADLYWAERDLNRAIRWEMRDFDVW